MEHSGSGGSSSSSSWKSGGGGGREMHGPRPAPLRVHKDSHRIRKPPQQPVIIYTVSPKVIHASPADFMSVVQRLTGGASSGAASSSHAPPSSPMPFPFYAKPPPPAQPQLPFPFHLQAAAAAAAMAPPLHQQLSPSAGALPSMPGSLPPTDMPPPGSIFSPPSGGSISELVSPGPPAFLVGQHGATPPPGTTTTMLQYFQAAAAPTPSSAPNYWDLFNNNDNHPD